MKRRTLAPKVAYEPTSDHQARRKVVPLRQHCLEPGPSEFRHYEHIMACRISGQIDDEAWQRYLADDDFAAWHLVETLQR